MTAAELLRSLDKAMSVWPGEWRTEVDNARATLPLHLLTDRDLIASVYGDSGAIDEGAAAIATTRNLLPELAALVEAVEGYITFNSARRHAELIDALDNLNAKAAELGGR